MATKKRLQTKDEANDEVAEEMEAEENVEEDEEEEEEGTTEGTKKRKQSKVGKGKQKRSAWTSKEKLALETAMLKNEGRDFVDLKASLARLPKEIKDAHTERSIEKKAREIFQVRKRQAAELVKIEEEKKLKKKKEKKEEEEQAVPIEGENSKSQDSSIIVEEPLLVYDPYSQFQYLSTFRPIAIEQNGFLYLYWPIVPSFVGYKVQVLLKPYQVMLRIMTVKLTREELDFATEAFGERLPLPDDDSVQSRPLILAWKSSKRLDQEQMKDHQTPHFFILRIRIVPDEPTIKERTDISIHKYIEQLNFLSQPKPKPADVEIVTELPALKNE